MTTSVAPERVVRRLFVVRTYAQAVADLPPLERAVIRLYVEDGASLAEAAGALDVAPGVAAAIYAAAQAHLRAALVAA